MHIMAYKDHRQFVHSALWLSDVHWVHSVLEQ